MKYLTISLLLAGSFIALSTMEASAVVCARGVVRPWRCCRAAGGRCSPQSVLTPSATHQPRDMPRYQRLIGSRGRTMPYRTVAKMAERSQP